MTTSLSFKIHADLDGYLDDPVLGPINEMIHRTIVDISEPDSASNRPYSLRQPSLAIFIEAYTLMNQFADELHPEESFVQCHFPKLRSSVIDTYMAEAVVSVVYVLLYLQKSLKSQRLISVIKKAIDTNSGCFKAFEHLAVSLEKAGHYIADPTSPQPTIDWQTRFFILQEQYLSLLAVYQSVTDDAQLQLFPEIPTVSKEAAKNGVVLMADLMDAAVEANTSNLFEVLRFYIDKTKGNLKDYVNAMEVIFKSKVTPKVVTYLALTDNLSELDLIRIIRSFVDGNFVVDTRTNKTPTYKELYAIAEQVFNIDLSHAATSFSNSITKNCSENAHKAIFETMGEVLVKESVKTKYK